MRSDRALCVFITHRDNAKKRGIPFKFTFEEWVVWWETQLGPDWLSLRGRKRGQYVMGRKNDCGEYIPGNVNCITVEQNHKEQAANGLSGVKKGTLSGEKHPQVKLTELDVKSIRNSNRDVKWLAQKFDVNAVTIKRIRSGKGWSHLNVVYPPPDAC